MTTQPSRTVLIVDDSSEDRELYRRCLLRDREYNYTILEAQLGREGLALWQCHKPDVVLLDYRLPDIDGLEWLAQLSPRALCLPVIIVTGQGNETITVKAMKAGAQDYLVKDLITPERLQHAVRETIERVKLQTQLQQRIDLERLVARLTGRIHQSLDLDEILQTTVTMVRQFLQTDRVSIFCIESEGWGTVINESVGADWTPLLSTRLHDPCLNADYLASFHQGRFTAKSDIHDGSIEPCHVELLTSLQVRANLVVPIVNQQLWGLLIAHHCASPRQWSAIDIELLQEVAIQVGIAVQQADLYRQAQQELVQRKQAEATLAADLRDTQLLRDLAARPIAEGDIQSLYQEILATAIALTQADAGTVQILDAETQVLVLIASQGFDSTTTDRFHRLDASSNTPCGIALETGERSFTNFDVPERDDPEGSLRMHVEAGYLSAQSSPLVNRTGRPIGMLSTHWREHHRPSDRELRFLDLLARQAADLIGYRQSEAILQENEQLLRLALTGARAGSWDWDLTMGKLTWSAETYHLHGLDPAAGLPDYEAWYDSLLHPDDRTWVNAYVSQAIERRLPELELEFRILHPEQGVRWLLSRGRLTLTDQGDPIRLSGINLDITDRKQAEEQQAFQAFLLNQVQNAVIATDLEGRVTYWNQFAQQLYQLTPEDRGRSILEVTVPVENGEIAQKIMESIQTTGTWEGEFEVQRRDGSCFTAHVIDSLLRDPAGNPCGFVFISMDITAQKQLEAQFLRAQRLESLGTLASGIAHDLNNILAPMMAIAPLLPLDLPPLSEQSQNLLTMLQENAKRATDLVKQILTFARGLGGERAPVQVKHLLRELEQTIRSTLPKSITITLNIATRDLWMVSADATQLHQVFMNFCVNARDAMPQGGTLSIAAENKDIDETYVQMHLDAKVGSYLMITLADTGIGIAPEHIDRIFEPFFTTKSVGEGTGLGLSTSLGIIKSHGGFVAVHSKVGKGTQFQVFLPAIEECETFSESSQELPLGHGELILVVDDEVNIRETMKIMLESHNYRVITACDGIEAIARYAEHMGEIHGVLMDMMMPEMDGITTIQTLQKMNPQVKVIATSGLADDFHQSVRALGINTLLPKPFTTTEVLHCIYEIIHVVE